MRTRILKAVPALALFAVLGACDEGLTDVNRNPNEPENIPPANLLGNAIMDAVGGAYGSHGEWFGMYLSDLWAQHLAQPEYNSEDRYEPRRRPFPTEPGWSCPATSFYGCRLRSKH